MSFHSWNDFFSRQGDGRTPEHSGRKQRTRTYDDFEHDYRELFGVWFDHHYLQLMQQYGAEEGPRMMEENYKKLEETVRRRQEEEKKLYEFHDVPAGCPVPF